MKRRDLLLSMAGFGLGISLPTMVSAEAPVVETVIGDPKRFPYNFDRVLAENTKTFSSCDHCNAIEVSLQQKLNRRMIEENPDLFVFEYQAPAPTFIYLHEGVHGVATVQARALQFRYSLEEASDLRVVRGSSAAEDELMLRTVKAAGDEMREWKDVIFSGDVQIAWYVPLLMIRAVDSETFAPCIGFKTRFATMPIGAQIVDPGVYEHSI